MLNLKAIKARSEAALQMVTDLCKRRDEAGARDWIMSIPARPEHDPDLVIGASLGDVSDMVAEVERLGIPAKPPKAFGPASPELVADVCTRLVHGEAITADETWQLIERIEADRVRMVDLQALLATRPDGAAVSALAELVRLKPIKSLPDTDSSAPLADRVDDYERRNPAAWAVAFALIPE